MPDHKVVSKEEWVSKRKELLRKEKELTRQRDQLAKERRELPWVAIDKEYIFDGPNGKEKLSDLFDGRSQLIVYHFMFQPDWTEGCKSCSLLADNYDSIIVHLRERDTNMVTISRAAFDKIESFRKRMGWKFKWLSSVNSDFNDDFHVSFPGDPKDQKQVYYNYAMTTFPSSEGPGISVFHKDREGKIFHTYSSYGRGLEEFLVIYSLLDIVPKGRNEEGLPYPMAWVRHHDKYGDQTFKDIYVELLAKKS
jgi:predicted dithiol-disulfide oxidoreductase (DUF899 family)